MKIIPFDDRYLEETVKLFCEVYSTEYRAYSEKWAKERILNNLKTGRDYSFVAVSDDGKYLGALICKSDWGDQGKEVHIDSNQVVPGARRQGVGEKLMEAVVDKARGTRIKEIIFEVDETEKFPSSWYEKMGFERTKWVVYTGEVDKVHI